MPSCNLSRLRGVLGVMIAAVVAAACATGPQYDASAMPPNTTPRVAVTDASLVGTSVVWGGRVLEIHPGEETTTLEVLAFPLRRNQSPDIGRSSQGRFLVVAPEFLEPGDWGAGRLVTVSGRLSGTREGRIGEADYRFPVVDARDLHLWSAQSAFRHADGRPRISFGFGLILSR